MSQTNQIMEHLKRKGSITALDALGQYGCFRLAARICDLRERGHNIETVITERKGKRFATYRYYSKAVA